jgi:hypothetical protein
MISQATMRQLFLTLLLLSVGTEYLSAQEARDGAPRYSALRRELIRMGQEDQKHREELVSLMKELPITPDKEPAMKKFAALVKKQDAIDKKNLNRLEEIIKRYGWPTRSMVGQEASETVFLIIQHADLKHQKKYFPLLKEAAAKNEARPDHAAMMEDRILMREGKKQIYGTGLQTDDMTKELKLWPIENEEEVDARRAAVGLPPMAEFFKVIGLKYNPPNKNNRNH